MKTGLISLANDFNIHFILLGGRVSLASLIEFSHFVDLYVFENDILVEPAAKSTTFDMFAEVDTDCPFRTLPEEKLADTIYWISIASLGLYDCAPINHSFSMDSYDYWLNVSAEQKREIGEVSNTREKFYSRENLLAHSKTLEEKIFTSLELLSKTKYTLMPSPRNLLPYMSAFHQIDTPILRAYREVSAVHRKKLDGVIELLRPRMVYLPPLLSILLSRCQSSKDLIKRLVELRAEYKPLRQSFTEWFRELDGANSISEKIKIRNEFDKVLNSSMDKAGGVRQGFYKELADNVIEAVEDGDPVKLLTKPAVSVVKEAITNWLPDVINTRRYTGLVTLLDEAFKIQDYGNLLHSVFGEKLDISQRELTEVKKYHKTIIDHYGLQLPYPG